MQLGGSVGDAQRLRGHHHLDERHFVGDAKRTVQVQPGLQSFTLSQYAIPKLGTVDFAIQMGGLSGGTFIITVSRL